MIKIPAGLCVKNIDDFNGRFFGEKEVRLLPPSILRALNKKHGNLFLQTTADTEGGATVALDYDVQSDYMDRQFN